MSDAYAIVDILKSLPIHGMALTSTGRKIEHRKVTCHTQTAIIIHKVSNVWVSTMYIRKMEGLTRMLVVYYPFLNTKH